MPPASLLRSSRLSAGACPPTLRLVHLSCDVLADENESTAYQEGVIGYGNGSRQAQAQAPTVETNWGEERQARLLV